MNFFPQEPRGTPLRKLHRPAFDRSEPSIYFVRAGTDGPVKIGIANNVLRRLETLQTANAYELRLLVSQGVFCGEPRRTEARFHRIFADYRLCGEWFEPVVTLLYTAERMSYGEDALDAAEFATEHLALMRKRSWSVD